MKIGLLIYGSLDTLSGGYIYDKYLVDYLEAQGDQVEMISLPWRDYPRHLLDNFSRGLRAIVQNLDVDILIQDELNHPSVFWLNHQIKKHLSYPVVSLVHHLRASESHAIMLRWLYRALESHYLKSIDAFIFNSNSTKRTVANLLPKLPPYIVAHPGGDRPGIQLSEAEIRQRAAGEGPLRVLFLGSITRRKQPHLLVEALARLSPREVEITLIGNQQAEPRYARRLQKQIQALPATKRARLLNPLDGEHLADELAAHDVLAVPSSYEGFGIVYLEGMACGLPAIATTGGGAREIIEDGVSGFLIPPGDASALAASLHALAADPARLLEMSLAARSAFQSAPTWQKTTARIRKFLLSLG